MALDLVEGWSEAILYSLKRDSGDVQVLTGITVTLQLYDKNNALQTGMGAAGVEDALTGKVYFHPGATDLLHSKSPYMARWKCADINGKVAYFPQGEPEIWNVRKP